MSVFNTPKIAPKRVGLSLRATCTKVVAAAAVLVAVSTGTAVTQAEAAPLTPSMAATSAASAPVSQHWNFSSPSDLTNNWVAQPGHGYGVDAATGDADLVKVNKGVLTLTARRAKDGTWRGPRYKTTNMYQNGTFTARIKVPAGQGAWPAFWLCDAYQPTGAKTKAEIDMLETINKSDTLYSSVHNWTGGHWQKTSTAHLTAGWHTYRLSWGAQRITFYLDGKVVRSLTHADLPSWPFNTPMYVIMNVSVGGAWAGAPTASTPAALPMQIDYVDIKGSTMSTQRTARP